MRLDFYRNNTYRLLFYFSHPYTNQFPQYNLSTMPQLILEVYIHNNYYNYILHRI